MTEQLSGGSDTAPEAFLTEVSRLLRGDPDPGPDREVSVLNAVMRNDDDGKGWRLVCWMRFRRDNDIHALVVRESLVEDVNPAGPVPKKG